MKINFGKIKRVQRKMIWLKKFEYVPIRENYDPIGFILGAFLRLGPVWIQFLCRSRREVYLWLILISLITLLKIVH